MTTDEVLKLFRDQAATHGELAATQHDIIERLANILASSQGSLPAATFNELVYIGAVIYQEGLGRFRARAEVAETMRKATQGEDH